MFKSFIIGNLGADAVTKTENGKTFSTFRVAHNDRWTDQAGQEHSSTMWIDCILSERPAVVDYLKAGTQVYVEGATKTRVYSSEKDRCMKAGVTISVQRLELLGGSSDAVPSRLVGHDGKIHDVTKFYHTDCPGEILTAQRGGRQYAVDDNGWVVPYEEVKPNEG